MLISKRSCGTQSRIGSPFAAGATHSSGGLVTDWDNTRNVLVVSLAEYVAPGPWEYSFKERSAGKATVMVNAGWSPLQLYAQIRPLNYFLPTQPAGPVFQLGGLVANCVHGGSYQKGFLHQYVVSMRVMLHNGTSRVIDDESELRYWRNSYGLLGFITSLEFTLDYRPRFQAYFKKQQIRWNEEDFWTFLKQEAHADIPEEEAPFGQRGDRRALMGQFFFNPYEAGEKGRATMSAVVWRANENATEPRVRSTAPRSVGRAYRRAMKALTRDEILSGNPQGGRARRMTSSALSGPKMLMDRNRRGMNDGFFATKVPNVVYGAYFVKPKDQGWKSAFKHVEDEWVSRFGAKPHLG